MKKLISLYKSLSIIETFLLVNILLHIVFFIPRTSIQNLDLVLVFFIFLAHLIISWKIISFTFRNLKANETLVIIGHIVNVIKLILLLLIAIGGIFFYTGTNQYMTIDDERGTWYYLFFLSLVAFIIVVLLIFICYFGIAKENVKKIKIFIDSITPLKE